MYAVVVERVLLIILTRNRAVILHESVDLTAVPQRDILVADKIIR